MKLIVSHDNMVTSWLLDSAAHAVIKNPHSFHLVVVPAPVYHLANLSLHGPKMAAGFPDIVPETITSRSRRVVIFSLCLL